jgi:aryl-alcohol dehydrogenase-like predicted oxidoreductase
VTASIGLGTASFAGQYGIKGDGAPDGREQWRICSLAKTRGVRVLDVSDDYQPHAGCFLEWFDTCWKTRSTPSMDLLWETPLYAAMLHMPAEVRLLDNLHRLKQWGAVEKVGVSAYNAEQLWRAGAGALDIVQVPLNILDARLLPTLREYHRQGIEVHVRSAFLQGALLMEPTHLPRHFDSVAYHLADWHVWREHQGLTAVEAALGPLLSLDCVDVVVVGVNSVAQLREVLAVKPLPWTDRWAIDDVNILEPWRWPRG